MIYFAAVLSSIFRTYRRCPNCKKLQHFKDKKKGDIVTCKKCSYEFILKS
jgi:DNA-directed RNA polymerase subunit M/transcription elongation factor TFIIS